MLEGLNGLPGFDLARERYALLLREAEIDRTLRQIRESEPGTKRRWVLWVGDALMALGYKLKGREGLQMAATNGQLEGCFFDRLER